MNLDPFAVTKPRNQYTKQPQNFAEALKSIGGHFQSPEDSINTPETTSFESQESSQKLMRHKEVLNTTPIYDRRQEEVKAQIKQIQEELRALAKDLTNLSLTTQKALNEVIVNPGTYHISYLEKLRRFVINLRKQVQNANNWLELSYHRRQSKQHYWGSVKQSGTKFMLSQERYMATSAG